MPPRLSSPACWWPGLGELRTAWLRSWKTLWLQGMEGAGEVMPEIGYGVSFPRGTLRSCRPRYDNEGPTLGWILRWKGAGNLDSWVLREEGAC